jgi:hypothetical protein
MSGERGADPDGDSYGIFAIYGATMLEVQSLELAIAILVLVVETEPGKKSNASLERQLKKILKRSQEAFQRNPVSVLRNKLKGKIADELYVAIDEFIPQRNHLAHSFLRERLASAEEGGGFKRGSALALTERCRDFRRLNREVIAERERVLATFPQGEEESAEMAALGETLARAVMPREAPSDGKRS